MLLGVLIWVQEGSRQTEPRSPYGIPEDIVARYFADATHRHGYQVTASTLHSWLASGKPILLIDVRQPNGTDGYNKGHIPGAYNIPLQWFGTELTATHRFTRSVRVGSATETIQFFPLPTHIPIVIMCYDGNGGEMTPVVLRLLGYHAYGLTDGVSSWNAKLDVWPVIGTFSDFPVVTGPGSKGPNLNPAVTGRDLLGYSWKTRLEPFWHGLNHPYPVGYSRPWTINKEALWALLAGPHPPEVLDLRSRAQFRAGHIGQSLNIPFAQLGANLALISRTRQVVLVSRTLQDAAQANAILRLMGYHSYVLEKGLAIWNSQFGTIDPPYHFPIVPGLKRG